MKAVSGQALDYVISKIRTYINRPQNDNEWIQIVYPVGAIYMSVSDVNPALLFGFGVWEQIKDVFLLTAGDLYAAGSVGGEETHTLDISEIPGHDHTYKRHAFDRNDDGSVTGESVYGVNNKSIDAVIGSTSMTGGGQPHNNMPPYLTVYAWKRIG